MSEDQFLDQFLRDINNLDHISKRDCIRCLQLRGKLYEEELKPLLCKYLNTHYNPDWKNKLSEISESYKSPNVQLEDLDPYHLLKLTEASIVKVENHRHGVHRLARDIRVIRNYFYGHVPELKITDTHITTYSTYCIKYRRPNTFENIIEEFNKLIEKLRTVVC